MEYTAQNKEIRALRREDFTNKYVIKIVEFAAYYNSISQVTAYFVTIVMRPYFARKRLAFTGIRRPFSANKTGGKDAVIDRWLIALVSGRCEIKSAFLGVCDLVYLQRPGLSQEL
jgi:hypothetical protein